MVIVQFNHHIYQYADTGSSDSDASSGGPDQLSNERLNRQSNHHTELHKFNMDVILLVGNRKSLPLELVVILVLNLRLLMLHPQ